MLTEQETRDAIVRLSAERNDALARCADMERSANSAREIARVAMSHTGTKAIRVELAHVGGRLNIVLCAPASDERDMISCLARMLDPAICDALGLDPYEDPAEVGATK